MDYEVSGSGTWTPKGPINSWQYATYRINGKLVTLPVTVAGDNISLSTSVRT